MEQVHRVKHTDLLKAIEDNLKDNSSIELPKNHDIIKTGRGRQNSPTSPDWFYARMAAIVRVVLKNGRVNLKTCCSRFGNRKDRGVKPTAFARGSKYVNASALNQLQAIGWLEKEGDVSKLAEKGKEVLTQIFEKISAE